MDHLNRLAAPAAILLGGLLLSTPTFRSSTHPETGEAAMTAPTTTATGTFDVELAPQPAGAGLGRMSIEKRYHGGLEATASGEMMTWQAEDGAAAYVAIEHVTGTLDGRAGSFVLTHRGTMTPDEQHLTVEIVPDSGTDGLAGISGAMMITIVETEHRYALEYELPGD